MDYNRSLNGACLGWALVILAIVLNIIAWRAGLGGPRGPAVIGILLGALTLGCAYFAETFNVLSYLAGYDHRTMLRRSHTLMMASIVLCILSYLSWFYAVLIA